MSVKKNVFLDFYDKKYKSLMILTFLMLIFSIIFIGYKYYSTGDFLVRGVSLKGGSQITIQGAEDTDIKQLQIDLEQKFSELEVSVRARTESGKQIGIEIDTAAKEQAEVEGLLNYLNSKSIISESKEGKNYSIQTFGSSLGANFFKQAMLGLLFSFILMAVIVFITFKDPIPSFFVVLAAFSNIVCTWAVVLALGIKLSTAGLAAFVMLILYSVDTDILLTSRVLRGKEGTVLERVLDAMGTGLTMTVTALIVALIGFLLSESDVIRQIMLILSIGLSFDLFNTWIQNAGILRWHLEKKRDNDE